jgi:hypothetical protein
VVENKSALPQRWIITIVPSAPKARADILRPAPRVRVFVEDFY